MSIQPSEFLKLALIIALAQVFAQLGANEERNRQLWTWAFLLSAASLVLVAIMGRDLGTGVVMAVLLMGMFLFAGMRWHTWLLIAVAGAASAAALIMYSPSRRIRFEAWLNPEGADPMGVRGHWPREASSAPVLGARSSSGAGSPRLRTTLFLLSLARSWVWLAQVR